MKKRMLVLLIAAMMLVVSAAPAMAVSDHSGCKAFGHYMAHRAHSGTQGETMRGYGRNGQTSTFIYYQKEFSCGRA
jgi:Spy/CpxP family protein refolding chaperone